MSEEKVFVDPRKQALLRLGIMDETPLETIERVFTSKNNEYGDSWCKRGELAFVASMARKVDRLEVCEPGTVGAFDTKLDLVAYLALYNIMLVNKWGSWVMPVDVSFRQFLRGADSARGKFRGGLNSMLIAQIMADYAVFYKAAVINEVKTDPLGYWAGTFGVKYSDVTDMNLPDVDARDTLNKAWVLYCWEHAYIKVLCK